MGMWNAGGRQACESVRQAARNLPRLRGFELGVPPLGGCGQNPQHILGFRMPNRLKAGLQTPIREDGLRCRFENDLWMAFSHLEEHLATPLQPCDPWFSLKCCWHAL